MKKRFTKEQIITVLKEKAGGKKATDIIREQGISEQTFVATLKMGRKMETRQSRERKSIGRKHYYP